ncbi:MAG: hypothetical protein KDA99_25890 [Planctomycetales bacterium]|nr:hypothetical protein [Planctomycetales bacterium]
MRGKLTIETILVLAVVAGCFAWWFRIHLQDQALAYWGTDAIRLIQRGSSVRLERISADGAVLSHRDIGDVPGLSHLRHALLVDATYDWPADAARLANQADDPSSSGDYRLVFSEDSQQAALYFNSTTGCLARSTSDGSPRQWLRLNVADGFREFFAEQFLEVRSHVDPDEAL